MKSAAALLVAIAASAATAADRMAPESFRDYSEGSTLIFAEEGVEDMFYGAEQYLSDGEVIWQDASGRCVRGSWEARGADLCFTYSDDPLLTLCWGFWHDEAGFYAKLVGSPQDDRLRVVARTDQPLQCKGPEAGV